MKNGRPVNLLPLLTGIRHPLASNKLSYEQRYCNAKKTKFCAWDTSGASHLEELQERLGGRLIRKTKVSTGFIDDSPDFFCLYYLSALYCACMCRMA
jgi:hypothetical protein